MGWFDRRGSGSDQGVHTNSSDLSVPEYGARNRVLLPELRMTPRVEKLIMINYYFPYVKNSSIFLDYYCKF